MHTRLETHRLLALFAAAVLLFNFPLYQLWSGRSLWLFGLWALLIACVAWLMERGGAEGAEAQVPAAQDVAAEAQTGGAPGGEPGGASRGIQPPQAAD